MEERDEEQRCLQQLIAFGHTQWGFNHWSWTVTKQDLDFVDFSNDKYTAGVVGFVSVVVKSLDIQRQNVGYATCTASAKGSAIHRARKCAVTNALRETLLSFGSTITAELQTLLEPQKVQKHKETENNQNIPNKIETVNSKKECTDNGMSVKNVAPVNNGPNPNNGPKTPNVLIRPQTAPIKNVIPPPPPMAKALPMPVNVPRPPVTRPQPRPNNEMQPLPAPSASTMVSTSVASAASEEEARAERKRRQRLAQEEFRLKQLGKKPAGQDDQKDVSSFDCFLMGIPTQDLMIEQSGSSDTGVGIGTNKRKSPDSRDSKRRSVMNRLDIVND